MSVKRIRLRFEQLESRQLLSGATAATAAATVDVHIPDNLTGQPGAEVVAPVEISSAAGVRGVEIRINYDTALLDATEASVQAGSLWPQANTQVVANVNDATGTIVVFVSTAEGLSAASGSLLDIHFTAKSNAPVGVSTQIDLASVNLNEGEIVANPVPQPGTDNTDGKITFGASSDTATVSGFVYADTNNNGRADRFEGIPRVKIVLVDAANGGRRETFTDDNGRYEFGDLAAGSYRIQETQPAAFMNGGTNQMSVHVADGESLVDQSFREQGLRPEYIYNRLFTTAAMPVGSTNWVTAVRRIVSDGESGTAGNAIAAAESVVQQSARSAAVLASTPLVAASQRLGRSSSRPSAVIAENAYSLVGLATPSKRTRAVDLLFANSNLRQFIF